MPTRRGTGQSALQELQRVTALLHDEVVPRLHDGEPPGNGRPNGSGSGSTDPDQDSASATGALRTLADLYQELSPEAASALDQLFSTFDGRADTTIGVGARAAPGGIPTQPGVRVGPIGRLLVQILTHYPKRRELAISSGFRPGPRSYHRGLPYKGSPAAAIDVVAPGAGKMRDVAKWLYDHFANDTVELIHTTPFNSDHGFYVKNQVKYPGGGPYDPPTRRQHRNHVHFATSKALAQSVLKGLQKTSVGSMAMAAPTRAMGVTRAVGARTAGRLSKRGAQFIAGFEGLRNRLYNDPAGHCTIGIGHLVHRGGCNGGEPAEFKRGISNDQAFALLQHDARQMEGAVNRLGVPLNQNQFDALVSFTYNLGPAWTTEKTGLAALIRARRFKAVPRELNKYVHAGGKVLPGLVRRRKAEGRLFATPAGPAPPPRPPGPVAVHNVQPGQHNGSVLVVQKALHKAVGLDYSSGPGMFGPRTRAAYAKWQRQCGEGATGKPRIKSLKMLGDKYGFKVAAVAPEPKPRAASASSAWSGAGAAQPAMA